MLGSPERNPSPDRSVLPGQGRLLLRRASGDVPARGVTEIKQANAKKAVEGWLLWTQTPRLWGFECKGFIGIQ